MPVPVSLLAGVGCLGGTARSRQSVLVSGRGAGVRSGVGRSSLVRRLETDDISTGRPIARGDDLPGAALSGQALGAYPTVVDHRISVVHRVCAEPWS